MGILNGVAGLVCCVPFIAGPVGHFLQAGALLPFVQRMPLASIFFWDFLRIGMAMLLVLGVPNSIAAVLLRKSEHQYLATLVVVGLISILSSTVLLSRRRRVPGKGNSCKPEGGRN